MGMSREEFVKRARADLMKYKMQQEKEYRDYVAGRVNNHYTSGSGKRDLCSNYKKKSYSHL